MPFEFTKLSIPDVILIKPTIFYDDRGFFLELYRFSDFSLNGIKREFVQDNLSFSKKNVLRGLHYQLNPFAQGKLVSVIKGSIFDVAVDIREGSPYYGRWVSQILTENDRFMLWIPEGFAHGFLSLQDNTVVLYKNTKEYEPSVDKGIIWNDPEIAINWPIKDPILSAKDSKHPLFREAEKNFLFEK